MDNSMESVTVLLRWQKELWLCADSRGTGIFRYLRFAVLLILLFTPCSIWADNGNSVDLSNGGFENGPPSFSPWLPRTAGEVGSTYQIVNDAVLNGVYCGKMTVTEDSSSTSKAAVYLARNDSNIPTATGWYRLTFWVKTDMTQGTVGAYVNVGGTQVAAAGTDGWPLISGKTPWTHYSVVYKITTPGAVVVFLKGISIRGSIWVDDLALESLTDPIANGGFEDGVFSPWVCRYPEGSVYTIPTEQTPPEGVMCAQIQILSTTSSTLKSCAYITRAVPSTAAGYYRITFWMKTALSKGTAGVSLSGQTGSGAITIATTGKNGCPIAIGNTDWGQYTFVYQLGSGVISANILLRVDGALNTTDSADSISSTAWFDKIIIEPVSATEGAAALTQQTSVSPDIEDVCGPSIKQPCVIVNPLNGLLYSDPANGRPMLALNSSTAPLGSALLVDYTVPNSETIAVPFPAGNGGWSVIPTLTERLLFDSTGFPLNLIEVDIRNKTATNSTPFTGSPTNSYAWELASGTDGCVYYGSYPSAHAYKFNPSTNTHTDLGSMDVDYDGNPNTPSNTYVRYVGITTDGWVLSSLSGSVGNTTAGVVAWKANTPGYPKMIAGTKGTVPTLLTFKKSASERTLYAWNFSGGSLKEFNTATMTFVEANVPPCPTGGTWTSMLMNSDTAILYCNGKYYEVQGNVATEIFNTQRLSGSGQLIGVNPEGNLIGFRGQSYFVCPKNPATLTEYLHPFYPSLNTPPPSVAPIFLRADPAGGITGGPCFGQTLFRYNPYGNWINTDQVVDSAGEVYDGRWYNNKFYFACYPTGEIAVWDPNQAWNQYDNVNPVVKADSSYTRPQGGMVQNSLTHKFYAGWCGAYYTTTGGLTEYDPVTETLRSWDSKQFDPNNNAVSIGTVATDNTYVYGVTSNSFNGISSPALQPQTFWMFNPSTQTVLARIPLGVTSGASCFYVPGSNHVWVASPTGLRQFNTSTKTLGKLVPWPAQCAYSTYLGNTDTLNNSAWIVAGSTVVQLHDGAYPWVEPLFKAVIGGIAANSTDNKLYTSSGSNLYWLSISE